MQNQENVLFIGIKINDKLRDQLDDTKASMRPFFNDNNPEYLQILRIDGSEYIGKTIENGASFEKLNNLLLNVKSMLKMIIPKFSFVEDALKLYAHTPPPQRMHR